MPNRKTYKLDSKLLKTNKKTKTSRMALSGTLLLQHWHLIRASSLSCFTSHTALWENDERQPKCSSPFSHLGDTKVPRVPGSWLLSSTAQPQSLSH